MPTLLPLLIPAVLGSAAITIAAHYRWPPQPMVIAIFKPLTTVLIIAIALLPGTVPGDPYASAIAVALVLSLAGDILLMFPQRFLQGLGAFLLAHIVYVVAFHAGIQAAAFPLVLLAVAAVAASMLRYLWGALDPHFKGPVAVYVIMVGLMAALAIGRFLGQPSGSTRLAAAGAVLFMCSDAMLALNRFRRPFRQAELGVLSTYFAAQLLIALSV